MHLPRGRFTDALLALAAFSLIFVALWIGLYEASLRFGFSPAFVWAGGWREVPLLTLLSPLLSAFVARDFVSAIFDGVLLLIAGRYVEKAIGPVGLGAVFVAGCYGGALLRLLLTPHSMLPSAGLTPALFAAIGAYLMLYGVPASLPVPRHLSRSLQIGVVAGFWLAVQLVFSFATKSFELSVSIVDPIGGLVAGMLLGRPLLSLKYRKA
jgi:membrane associated rhomboid family serine protease